MPNFNTSQILSWAWSANLPNSVLFNRRSKQAVLVRWDRPDYHSTVSLATREDLSSIVREFEQTTPPVPNETVLAQALDAFSILRQAVEERGGRELDVVVAFNAFLALASEPDVDMKRLESLEIRDVFAQKTSADSLAISGYTAPKSIRSYQIGQLTSLLLSESSNKYGYRLDVDLMLRHASGDLYQEAHRSLEGRYPSARQVSLIDDSLPVGRPLPRSSRPRDIHYTPVWLARATVNSAFSNLPKRETPKLRILDPACGSGVFVTESLREATSRGYTSLSVTALDRSQIATEIAGFCIRRSIADFGCTAQLNISGGLSSLANSEWGLQDVIVMNPPFKSVEVLSPEERDQINEILGDLRHGRPDLYQAFLVKAARSLAPGGVLSAVVPSSFLSSESSQKIRMYLNEGEYSVFSIFNFRDYQIFADASVQAAVVTIGRDPVKRRMLTILDATSGFGPPAVRRIRESNTEETPQPLGYKIARLAAAPPVSNWKPIPTEVVALDKLIRREDHYAVSDLFDVRLGIRGVGTKKRKRMLVVSQRDIKTMGLPDSELAYFRPTADTIVEGRIVHTSAVFYPFGSNGERLINTESELKRLLPRFYSMVLRPNRDDLKSRGSLWRRGHQLRSKKWWEPAEPLTSWICKKRPRIVSQEFGRKGNFGLDATGELAVVAGLGWIPTWNDVSESDISAYHALLNSRVFSRILRAYAVELRGGQFKLGKSHVRSVPLPAPQELPPLLREIGRRIRAAAVYRESDLDRETLSAYGVPPETAAFVIDELESESQQRFDALVKAWRSKTVYESRVEARISDISYQKIIRMGNEAITFILKDMVDNGPDDWFEALFQITGEDPIPPRMYGFMAEMTSAWLEWGNIRGLFS